MTSEPEGPVTARELAAILVLIFVITGLLTGAALLLEGF
jgi:hypothetical protein